MDIVAIHLLNALLYASVLFLIAGGLSLIYGVMRIVNLAHGNLYAFGAYVSAWIIGYLSISVAVGEAARGARTWVLLALLPAGALAAAAVGALLEPTLLRPFYRRAEEYQLLVTFGLLMILDDVIRSFIVVVVGGLGSLEGALLGALIVGFVREAGIAWFPEVELAVLYLIAALVLLVRPAG